MRYKELLSEQQLDELRMSPGSLRSFAGSSEAEGIRAGFEAELVFTGLGGDSDDDYDMEPDMDADERCRSIQQVMDFFENDEWGYGVSGRQADRLQEGLDEMYWEWHEGAMYDAFREEAEDLIKKVIEEDDFDWEDETRKQLDMMELSDSEIEEAMKQGGDAPKFTTSSEQEEYAQSHPGYQRYLEAREQAEGLLDDLVQDSLSSQDKNYDAALDEFRDNFYMDDDSGFFSDVGLRWMSDVQDQFDLYWPVMTSTGSSEGGFSEENASQLAKSLSDELGVKTKVSSNYHSTKRDDVTWIFEPDMSLDADDSDNMPVEIVSPPMPLEECLRQMENFFAWAESNGAYANSSTGFHMGVSLPVKGGQVDYVKLALFLGDEYVLKDFGRSSNNFCQSAIGKIKSRVKGNKEAVSGALELMKHNLLELAQKALEINNHGFGKYTSINPQGGVDSTKPHEERGAKYIEFRSAGGTNYFEDIDKLKNTLMRYAKAMTVAADPSAERKEYYKKLYKLISPPDGDPSLDLFARFATGDISSAELKKAWAEKQLSDEPKGDWKLWNATNGLAVPGQEYNGYTRSDALERAKQKLQPGSSMEDFLRAYKLLPMKSQTGDWEVYDVKTGETLETLHGFETKGAAADSVYDKYSEQGIAFNLRPADPEAPEKPLSPREKLAKNIKQAPPEKEQIWQVVNRRTGEVYDDGVRGTKSGLSKVLRGFEKEKGIPQGDAVLKLAPEQDKKQDDVLRTWEIVDRMDNNKVLDTVGGTEEQAERVRQGWVQRAGRGEDSNIGKRSVPTDASRERYEDRGNWEFFYEPTGRVLDRVTDISQTQARSVLADVQRRYGDLAAPSIQMRKVDSGPARDPAQAPEGFVTQRPATGDYYEVRSGDRVYGYVSTQSATDTNRSIAIEVKTYINQLTGRNDAQLVYRAGDPVQATAPNGVPMWEVYERDSGHVIHTFADHTQQAAWEQARSYLRGIGAENLNAFSCRPKMES